MSEIVAHPDAGLEGGLEAGYAKAVEALIIQFGVRSAGCGAANDERHERTVNILAGAASDAGGLQRDQGDHRILRAGSDHPP